MFTPSIAVHASHVYPLKGSPYQIWFCLSDLWLQFKSTKIHPLNCKLHQPCLPPQWHPTLTNAYHIYWTCLPPSNCLPTTTFHNPLDISKLMSCDNNHLHHILHTLTYVSKRLTQAVDGTTLPSVTSSTPWTTPVGIAGLRLCFNTHRQQKSINSASNRELCAPWKVVLRN